jgi:hypothetical protein
VLRTLSLESYRGFRRFELHDLGRVNLIVGTNNSGKTSILEAAHMLVGHGDATAIWSALARRGEDYEVREDGRFLRNYSIRHLFAGHELAIGARFMLTGRTERTAIGFIAEVHDREEADDRRFSQPRLFESLDQPGTAEQASAYALRLAWDGEPPIAVTVEVNRGGGVSGESIRRARPVEAPRSVVRFITAAALSPDAVIEFFEGIVLTPEEEFIVRALQIIEPTIERLATSGTERWRGTTYRSTPKGGLLLRCAGIRDRIPIGSMGDGIWRLLGLSLALVHCRDGILLVDEIDTGLHYSVMEKMWRLVTETARRLNVQVFATTHSRDCFESLAAVCREDVSAGSEVTIQRIEREKGRSVAYTEQEIVAAARRGLEVR